ncbi:MAG: hypothetical protein ACE141_08105 [Bryobacteraceae bacterium]
MRRMLTVGIFLALSLSAFAAQSQPSAPPPDPPQAQELTPQVLGDLLRTATSFHELVTKLNLKNTFGPDQHVLGPDGRYHHSVSRTAAYIGAGAGAGAAIGGMARGANGVFIGAIVGSAGGLILDQVMRHREEARERAIHAQAPDVSPEPRELLRR